MNYPTELLPQAIYKKIETGFEEDYLVRKANILELINPSTGYLRDEVICANDYHLVGYSTNLGSQYKLEFIPIEIIGENRKYFNELWNETSTIQSPIFEQDFIQNDNCSHFFLQINEIHHKIKLPYNRESRKGEEYASAIVRHVPTNCNYWHFEINWKDQEGIEFNTNKATWKTLILASIKAIVRELAIIDEMPTLTPMSEEYYVR